MHCSKLMGLFKSIRQLVSQSSVGEEEKVCVDVGESMGGEKIS